MLDELKKEIEGEAKEIMKNDPGKMESFMLEHDRVKLKPTQKTINF